MGWLGFFSYLKERRRNKRESSPMPVLWRNCSLFLTHCRNCLCERKIVCCRLSHLSLGVMRLAGLLPRPSAALLDREHPYNSRHCLMCRATGCPSCTSVFHQWTVGGGTGKKQERFFFLSQLEIFIATASHPRHHRPPWGARAAGLMPTLTRGLIGGCCHFAVAKAGISGGSVSVTWTTHNPVSSWIVTLSHNFPPETDSLVYVNVWTVL